MVRMSRFRSHVRRSAYEIARWVREERLSRRIAIHPDPGFILGMQKSGTSAVAGLLSLRTGIPIAIDLAREWRRCTIIRASGSDRAFERYVRRNGIDFARRIVKEPGLTFVYDRLAARWPEARSLVVVRDPVATIRSIVERLEIPGDADASAIEMRPLVPQAWHAVLDNRWLGVRSEHYIDQLADRWCIAARLALDVRDGRRMIRYEDFVADKIGVIDEIAGHFEIPIVAEIDAFLEVPFQPPGRRREPKRVFGPNLERIKRITAPLAHRLGYQT
ncbi:MAG: hypothetical protein CMJ52_06010 [Planctomycetaceae bacterium]|nr:hypothetical protein [Planctomycetaceae bacterium]